MLKNSKARKSREKFGISSLRFERQETTFEKAGFGGKMFCQFARLGLHTEFFNTIGSELPFAVYRVNDHSADIAAVHLAQGNNRSQSTEGTKIYCAK